MLKEALGSCSRPPQAFIQAGSLAIFGDTTLLCDEGSPHVSGGGGVPTMGRGIL
ncbi:hypothetical protein [Fictibacillus sp. S7]|uniref:hypothetical protein n=1 Tax=Fictibacillus sp. S7 TaxID=2212476 RepID=UPI001F51D880|nr:hypothetical protein [Fictibacillus sp. S7]